MIRDSVSLLPSRDDPCQGTLQDLEGEPHPSRHGRQRATVAAPRSLDGWAPLDTSRLEGWYARVGRTLGTIALLSVCIAPVLLISLPLALINLLVFRDVRRILYSQERVGLHGRRFSIYKFRTMRDAPGTAFDNWQRGDPSRVTGFGRFLRRTHLDELPQLINILRGEMGFVGPRPEMIEVEEWAREAVPGFSERLLLRPGITGHAQVTQGHTCMDREQYTEKLRANRFYIANLSFFFDLAILARTILCVLPIEIRPTLAAPLPRLPQDRVSPRAESMS